MPQITAIKPQKRQKRVNVFLDGKFSFGLDLETLAKESLKVGQRLSEKKVEEILKEGELAKVESQALKFLGYRPRSESELKRWFQRKNIGDKTQEMIIKKLRKLDYLNDKEFAKWWLEQRVTFRPLGFKAIRAELGRKGLTQDFIDEFLAEVKKDFSELEMAKRAAAKKLKSLKGLSESQSREKLIGFLARRGFSWAVIKEAISSLL